TDAVLELGIAAQAGALALVELAEQIELGLTRGPRGAGGQGEVAYAVGANDGALVARGQEAGLPGGLAAEVLAGEHDDEAGQVAVVAAQAVVQPGAEAGPVADLRPGHGQVLGRRVDRTAVPATAEHADVIDVLADLGKQLGHGDAALAA